MTLRIPAKVLIHVWSYDLYDMALSTGKQRRHMINTVTMKTRKAFVGKVPRVIMVYRCVFTETNRGELGLQPGQPENRALQSVWTTKT